MEASNSEWLVASGEQEEVIKFTNKVKHAINYELPIKVPPAICHQLLAFGHFQIQMNHYAAIPS